MNSERHQEILNWRFSKISLSKKMLISNAVIATILLVLLSLLVTAKLEPIQFSQLEIKGNQYQKPLEQIFLNLAKHRIIAQRVLNGDEAGKTLLIEIQRNLDTTFIEMERVDSAVGIDLQFTEEGLKKRQRENSKLSLLKQKWNDLKGQITKLNSAESNALHSGLLSDVRTLISHAGDTSNLILDPDLDSYYLMDITLLAMPQIQDRIQNVIVEVEPILRRKSITAEERLKLAVFVSMMKEADAERVKADFQTVLNEDANFYGVQESLHNELAESNKNFLASYGSFIEVIEKISNATDYRGLLSEFIVSSEKALEASFTHWDHSDSELDKLLLNRISTFSRSMNNSILLSLLAMLGFGIFSWLFSRSLTRSLQQVVSQLIGESSQIKTASESIAGASQNLAESSTQQATAIQQTAASIEEMEAMVRKSSENSDRSRDFANKSSEVARKGKTAVENMISSIAEINESNSDIMRQISESNRQISEIVVVIKEIGNKTNVINEIVFQTKLLSFNASVEAARAGEYGKGFAVVAEEVGNLAQMSGNAAKEISEMLSSSIHKVERIVKDSSSGIEQLISLGKQKVEHGTSIAQQCGEILDDVVINVSEVNVMVGEIMVAAQEQALGISEITKAMNQMDEGTHANADTSHQAASFAEELSGQSESLIDIISTLETFIYGFAGTKKVESHLSQGVSRGRRAA